ncbi:MAG TPA: hypothetical protein VMF51_08400 [Nocardioides sp.]|uniref:hypothetical protein n=1 Tax=Nocardioides sp. TaxID=35761 RepID=UPI002C4817AC|nr:hypothetical protein [Nocardioides sp.]HTW15136.1 hypothetical protein [Nocardioides sp.]
MTTLPGEVHVVEVPDLAAVKEYLERQQVPVVPGAPADDDRTIGYLDTQVQRVLDAETDLQARACRVAPYTAALAEALCRRVHCALARRNLPLGVDPASETGARPSANDPEVRRMERPFRKVIL